MDLSSRRKVSLNVATAGAGAKMVPGSPKAPQTLNPGASRIARRRSSTGGFGVAGFAAKAAAAFKRGARRGRRSSIGGEQSPPPPGDSSDGDSRRGQGRSGTKDFIKEYKKEEMNKQLRGSNTLRTRTHQFIMRLSFLKRPSLRLDPDLVAADKYLREHTQLGQFGFWLCEIEPPPGPRVNEALEMKEQEEEESEGSGESAEAAEAGSQAGGSSASTGSGTGAGAGAGPGHGPEAEAEGGRRLRNMSSSSAASSSSTALQLTGKNPFGGGMAAFGRSKRAHSTEQPKEAAPAARAPPTVLERAVAAFPRAWWWRLNVLQQLVLQRVHVGSVLTGEALANKLTVIVSGARAHCSSRDVTNVRPKDVGPGAVIGGVSSLSDCAKCPYDEVAWTRGGWVLEISAEHLKPVAEARAAGRARELDTLRGANAGRRRQSQAILIQAQQAQAFAAQHAARVAAGEVPPDYAYDSDDSNAPPKAPTEEAVTGAVEEQHHGRDEDALLQEAALLQADLRDEVEGGAASRERVVALEVRRSSVAQMIRVNRAIHRLRQAVHAAGYRALAPEDAGARKRRLQAEARKATLRSKLRGAARMVGAAAASRKKLKAAAEARGEVYGAGDPKVDALGDDLDALVAMRSGLMRTLDKAETKGFYVARKCLGLSPATCARMEYRWKERVFQPGEVLVRQGHRPAHLLFIEAGAAEVVVFTQPKRRAVTYKAQLGGGEGGGGEGGKDGEKKEGGKKDGRKNSVSGGGVEGPPSIRRPLSSPTGSAVGVTGLLAKARGGGGGGGGGLQAKAKKLRGAVQSMAHMTMAMHGDPKKAGGALKTKSLSSLSTISGSVVLGEDGLPLDSSDSSDEDDGEEAADYEGDGDGVRAHPTVLGPRSLCGDMATLCFDKKSADTGPEASLWGPKRRASFATRVLGHTSARTAAERARDALCRAVERTARRRRCPATVRAVTSVRALELDVRYLHPRRKLFSWEEYRALQKTARAKLKFLAERAAAEVVPMPPEAEDGSPPPPEKGGLAFVETDSARVCEAMLAAHQQRSKHLECHQARRSRPGGPVPRLDHSASGVPYYNAMTRAEEIVEKKGKISKMKARGLLQDALMVEEES